MLRLQPCIDRVFGFDDMFDMLDALKYCETGAKLRQVLSRLSASC